MATVAYVIYEHHKRADGLVNPKIRITHKRKKAYIKTDIFLSKKQVNKKGEITDSFMLNEINQTLTDMRKVIVKLHGRIDLFSAQELARHIEQSISSGGQFELDFIAWAQQHADRLKADNRESTAKLFVTLKNSLERFMGVPKLSIESISVKFLERYEAWLRKEGLTYTGVNLYMRNLRTLFNAARKEYNDEDRGIIHIPHYPFARYKIPDADESRKRSLKPELIVKIRDMKLKNKREILARDVFMLSFYLIGMNTVDLYTCEELDTKDMRIIYSRQKTRKKRKDKAKIGIKTEHEVWPLLELYCDTSGDRVFRFWKMYADRSTFNANVNKGLKKIGAAIGVADLSSYFARHSWATIARNICQVSKEDIAMCLNHASASKVTDIYIDTDYTLIDNINRRVMDTLHTPRGIILKKVDLSHISTN